MIKQGILRLLRLSRKRKVNSCAQSGVRNAGVGGLWCVLTLHAHMLRVIAPNIRDVTTTGLQVYSIENGKTKSAHNKSENGRAGWGGGFVGGLSNGCILTQRDLRHVANSDVVYSSRLESKTNLCTAVEIDRRSSASIAIPPAPKRISSVGTPSKIFLTADIKYPLSVEYRGHLKRK